jgi:hypothetical protein
MKSDEKFRTEEQEQSPKISSTKESTEAQENLNGFFYLLWKIKQRNESENVSKEDEQICPRLNAF